MKKQKGKGAKAGTSKKKDEKTSAQTIEQPAEQSIQDDDSPRNGEESRAAEEVPVKEHSDVAEQKMAITSSNSSEKVSHGRQPSVSLQSKMRSASFRRTSLSQGPLSPGANGVRTTDPSIASPDGEYIASVYRTQATQLEELERENKRLAQEAESAGRSLQKTEQELDELREASGQVAELKSKAQKLEVQTEELSNTVWSPITTREASADNLIETSKCISSAPTLSATITNLQASRLLTKYSKCTNYSYKSTISA